MSVELLAMVAVLPILVALILMVGMRWPATKAMPLAWLVCAVSGILVWGLSPGYVAALTLQGIVTAIGDDIDDTVQHGDKAFELGALARLDVFQFVLGPLVDRAHTPDKHFGEIVATAHAHVSKQGHDQRIALLRQRFLEVGCVQAHGLVGQRT